MRAHALLIALLAPSALATPTLIPGDFIIISRSAGTTYTVNPDNGLIRDHITGPDLREGFPAQSRGVGNTLASFHTSIDTNPQGRIIARVSLTSGSFNGLVDIDLATGNRTLIQETAVAEWAEAGDARFINRNQLIALADDFDITNRGRLLRFNLQTNTTTVLSSTSVDNGIVMRRARAGDWLDADTFAVAEWNLNGQFGVHLVDVTTGDRTFLSRLSPFPLSRAVFENGVELGVFSFGDNDGGTGPVCNTDLRSLLCVDGRIFVGATFFLNNQYQGGIIEINPATGDRTLIAGSALIDDETASNIVQSPLAPPVPIDAPIGMCLTPRGTIAFTLLFDAPAIYELNIDTGEIVQVADLAAQFRESATAECSGLAVIPHPADLNRDMRVDARDLSVILSEFGVSGPELLADLNADTVVDGRDLSVFLSGFGFGAR